jgi:6-phosphogluconate dehydrogenase
MKRGLGMTEKEMGDVFASWNKGVLDSFLIEITRDIVRDLVNPKQADNSDVLYR